MIQYRWRRSADPRPILYLDVFVSNEHGWRLMSFAAYEVMANMAKELDR